VFEDPARLASTAARHRGACVVKLDGLAAGKGVIVADDGAAAAARGRRAVEAGLEAADSRSG